MALGHIPFEFANNKQNLNLFVQAFSWYHIPEDLYIAMEYCEHGDLHTLITNTQNGVDVKDSRSIMRKMAIGIEFIHLKGFAHRDFKPKVRVFCSLL